MRRTPFHTLAILLGTLAIGAALGGGDDKKQRPAHPALERLKTLAGDWVIVRQWSETPGQATTQPAAAEAAPADRESRATAGQDVKAAAKKEAPGGAEPAKPPAGEKPAIVFRVTAAGSVVHEEMFPGTNHEMVTVYHADGPELLLTHYCAAGNQPRMKLEPSSDPDRLVFRFTGGTNLDPQKDGHMHDATLVFLGPDRLREEWTFYENGKAVSIEKFELRRR